MEVEPRLPRGGVSVLNQLLIDGRRPLAVTNHRYHIVTQTSLSLASRARAAAQTPNCHHWERLRAAAAVRDASERGCDARCALGAAASHRAAPGAHEVSVR